MRREINLYFTAMSLWEALLLLFSGLKTLFIGNQGYGRWASHLESAWGRRFGGKEAVAFPSARSGLYALLRALGIAPGDEVIVTGFTCNAVPVPVLQCGAVPVYADIDPLTYAIDVGHVERLIGPKTKALVLQHTFGIPAAVTELVALARRRGLHVIEDVCLAMGSQVGGKPLGGFGDAAIFSFELSKTLSAGWGGLVQANVAGLGETLRTVRQETGPLSRWEAIRRLWQAGLSYFLYHPLAFWVSKYVLAGLFKWRIFRYSTSPEEFQGRFPSDALASPAAGHWRIIARQLDRLDRILDHSAQVADRYRDVLKAHGWPAEPLAEENSAVRLIRFPMLAEDRDRMTRYFLRDGIELGRWFSSPISPPPQDLAAFHYVPGQCPVSEAVSQHVVNLPLHPRLSSGDVDRICRVLDHYLAQYPEEAQFSARLLSVHSRP